jgi:hypothetical protein
MRIKESGHKNKLEIKYYNSGTSQNSPKATNCSYVKQHSNHSGLMKYNCGVRLPLPTYKS